MASAEGESVRSVVGYGEGCPKPTRGSGERRELSQRGPGQSAGRKRILAYFEGHRQNLGGGAQFASASPTPDSGHLSPVSSAGGLV